MSPTRRKARRTGRYASEFEATVAASLSEAGADFSYGAPALHYDMPRVYIGDFVVTTRSGKEFVVEAKGYFPPEDRRKMINVQQAHPDMDIRLVFQRANTKISRAKRARIRTYAEWAERHGFQWAEGTVPEDWINE